MARAISRLKACAGIVAAAAVLSAPCSLTPARALEVAELAGWWIAIDDGLPKFWKQGAIAAIEEVVQIGTDGTVSDRVMNLRARGPHCSDGRDCSDLPALASARLRLSGNQLEFFNVVASKARLDSIAGNLLIRQEALTATSEWTVTVEGERITLRVADGASLPFATNRFDLALAITVVLHVADPLRVAREMARVTRPGGRVGLQDQDFGVVAVTHPDRALTERIMRGVAERVYEEPHSGRRLPGLLRAAGLVDVRLLTDVYQDTTLEPWTKTFLERRAERAVRFGIVDVPTAEHWLDGFTDVVAADAFVLTLNYYGAVGVKVR